MNRPRASRNRCSAELPSLCITLLVYLLCVALVPHVTALDDSYAVGPIRQHYVSHGLARQGFFAQACLLIGGFVFLVLSSLLGPMMGISSMLWLMMRNDAAIDPRLAWMIFGAWLLFGLSYFMLQCHRVSNHRLYIFLSLALTYLCMCVVALIQKSSLQSGLVTVIPPCASFAAYSVAYFFPSKLHERRDSEV